MTEVRFESVSKHFDGVVALSELSLTAEDGEFLVLVGPSGCGKTTALRCLAGLEEPTSGQVFIGDKDVTYLEPKDRDIAMVFQSYALYPYMTVRDNMAFGLKLRKVPKAEIRKRVENAAEILGINELLDRKPRALSGGQRQRVALGRAIVRDPAAFLMDEPLSNLDAKLRVQTRTELTNLHRRLQATTIYVTHDQIEAMTMGSRIAVMNEGVLQQVDSPQTIYDNPANVFVASFIGSPAMALVTAGVNAATGTVVLPSGRLHLTGHHREALDGREWIIVGMRPEQLSLAHADARENTIVITVETVESLGSDLLVYSESVTLANQNGVGILAATGRISARLDPTTGVVIGDEIRLAVPENGVHLFDAETGMSLLSGLSSGQGTVPRTSSSPAALHS